MATGAERRRIALLRLVRDASLVALVAFAGYLAYEFTFNLPSDFGLVMGEVWGRGVLVDLYISLVMMAAWAAWREAPARGAAIAWVLAFLLLGNLATLAYVARAAHQAIQRHTPPVFFLGIHRTEENP